MLNDPLNLTARFIAIRNIEDFSRYCRWLASDLMTLSCQKYADIIAAILTVHYRADSRRALTGHDLLASLIGQNP